MQLLILLSFTCWILLCDGSRVVSTGQSFSVYPYLSGITSFNLINVSLTLFPGDIKNLCSSSFTVSKSAESLQLEQDVNRSLQHALYIKVITGCYPDVLANVAAASNFSILIVGDRVTPVGASAVSLWKYNQHFKIPVVAADASLFNVSLLNGMLLDLDPAENYYKSSSFLSWAIPLDVIFALLSAAQVFLSADRIICHYRATGTKFTTSTQVLIMELLEGITKCKILD
jgi:hypothetical protein